MIGPTSRLGERGWLGGQGLTGVQAWFVPPTTTDGSQRPKLLIVQWYHDQSMAEGVRVQIVMPVSVADALKARAQAEKRTVSSLGCYLVENGLRNLPPLPSSEK